jgi:hypothetical protein
LFVKQQIATANLVFTNVRSEVASWSKHAADLKSVSGLVSNSIVTTKTANQHIDHTTIPFKCRQSIVSRTMRQLCFVFSIVITITP